MKKLVVALLAKKADLEEENEGERDGGSFGMEEVKDKVGDEITMVAFVVEGKNLWLGIWESLSV